MVMSDIYISMSQLKCLHCTLLVIHLDLLHVTIYFNSSHPTNYGGSLELEVTNCLNAKKLVSQNSEILISRVNNFIWPLGLVVES